MRVKRVERGVRVGEQLVPPPNLPIQPLGERQQPKRHHYTRKVQSSTSTIAAPFPRSLHYLPPQDTLLSFPQCLSLHRSLRAPLGKGSFLAAAPKRICL